MRTREHWLHTIGFAVATAVAGLGFGGCAAWAFTQLGPAERQVVSLVASPWLETPRPPPLRRDTAAPNAARCVPSDWAQ